MLRAAQFSDWDGGAALLDAVNLPHDALGPGGLDAFQLLSCARMFQGIVGVEPHGGAGPLRSLACVPDLQGVGNGRLLVAVARA